MLMLLMALSFGVSEPSSKSVGSQQVASSEKLGIYKRKGPPPLPYTLNPQWQVAVIAYRDGTAPIQSAESNLEHWRNLMQTVKIEDITPRKAVPITAKSHDYFYSGSYNDQAMCTHAPWYLTVQEHWPEYFGSEPVLFYEVVRTPTMQKPYFEAIVCSMPNIRCKAKTMEALQEQLLQHYSQYLAKILQDEEDFPARQPSMRPNHEWLNGSFIAWLIGQSSVSDMNNDQVTQIFSFPIPDPNQWPWVQFGY